MADHPDVCFHDDCAQSVQFYLDHSGENEAMQRSLSSILPAEFKKIGEGSSSLDVLGVGLGGGQMDVYMLTLLQATLPAVAITSDVVLCGVKSADDSKALVAKADNLKTMAFNWHVMTSEDYMKQVKAKGDVKKFEFIHFIQMMCHVDDMEATIQFYHGLLKANGRLMIISEVAGSGWDVLWKTFKSDLGNDVIPEYRSCGEVKACLDKLGLKYDEHPIPSEFDVSECFDPNSKVGQDLLNFMTAKDFYGQFTPEVRAAMLDLIKTKCSTQKDGKVMFNNAMSCLLVHA